jgi:XTP/dITP diphosphohydrolase
MEICFATNNIKKVEEIDNLLAHDYKLLTLKQVGCDEELPETQDTLEGNSLQKAEYVYKNYKKSCFADDTGLEVAALNGEPGVYSARYAGSQRNNEDNINLLLEKLAGVNNREARFRTVITLILDGKVEQFEGIVDGTIIAQRRGGEGFGYDPVFQPKGYEQTFAEMTLEEKNKISHRAIAIKKLVDFLNKLK